jgi:Spy/CpxP family protein refolding chaperone
MKTLRWLAVLLPFASVACNNNNSSGDSQASASASAVVASASAPQPQASAATAPSASTAAADAGGPMIGRHAGAAGMLIRSSLDLAGLTDVQKDTIGKLGASLDSDDVRNANKTFRTDLVAGVRAGKVDTTKTQPDEAAVDKAVAAAQQKQADAINGLHAALAGDLRKALTAAVRTKQAAHEEKMPPMASDAGAADWQKRRVDRMTREFALDDAQQKQVTALVAKGDAPTPATMQSWHDDMKKKMEALLTAFEQDTFDAKKLDLARAPGKKAPHDALDKQVTFVTGMLGILRPEQRDKLAASLERPRTSGGPPAGPHNEGDMDPSVGDFDLP